MGWIYICIADNFSQKLYGIKPDDPVSTVSHEKRSGKLWYKHSCFFNGEYGQFSKIISISYIADWIFIVIRLDLKVYRYEILYLDSVSLTRDNVRKLTVSR